MDPISIATGAAIGAATSKLVDKVTESATKWLSSYFKDHQPKAQEQAKKNVESFLLDLAIRTTELENRLRKSGEDPSEIQDALNDPDFSAVMQSAIIASSRTSNKEKLKILSRTVNERLKAQVDSLVALASSLAIDAIAHLSPEHLSFLGIAAVTFHVRPDPFPSSLSKETFTEEYCSWLEGTLTPFLPFPKVSFFHFSHLSSVSCMRYDVFVRRDLRKVLNDPASSEYTWNPEQFLAENTVGKALAEIWHWGLQGVYLTPAGQLIGVTVLDERAGTKTDINW